MGHLPTQCPPRPAHSQGDALCGPCTHENPGVLGDTLSVLPAPGSGTDLGWECPEQPSRAHYWPGGPGHQQSWKRVSSKGKIQGRQFQSCLGNLVGPRLRIKGWGGSRVGKPWLHCQYCRKGGGNSDTAIAILPRSGLRTWVSALRGPQLAMVLSVISAAEDPTATAAEDTAEVAPHWRRV